MGSRIWEVLLRSNAFRPLSRGNGMTDGRQSGNPREIRMATSSIIRKSTRMTTFGTTNKSYEEYHL
jgi:hypothetical protein